MAESHNSARSNISNSIIGKKGDSGYKFAMEVRTEEKITHKIAFEKFLISCVVLFALVGCTYETGWSHNCTLICTNVSTNQQEEIQRVGKNADFSAVCKETKTTCEAGRSAACVNTANWTNTNEPLYNNCTSVSFGQCTEGCARN